MAVIHTRFKIAHPSSGAVSPRKIGSGATEIFAKVRKAIGAGWKGSVFAKAFDGIAEQRQRQAEEIVDFYGQDRWSDSLERKIDDARRR